jgi:hypothetical protein
MSLNLRPGNHRKHEIHLTFHPPLSIDNLLSTHYFIQLTSLVICQIQLTYILSNSIGHFTGSFFSMQAEIISNSCQTPLNLLVKKSTILVFILV